MKINNNSDDMDKRLDELLKARPAKASADFSNKVFERLHSLPEVNDALIDSLLSEMPVQASTDFASKVLRKTHREHTIITFMRPLMAAAASVAVSLTGLWVMEEQSPAHHEPTHLAVSAQNDIGELYTLAADLSIAAPLLETNAVDRITRIVNNYE